MSKNSLQSEQESHAHGYLQEAIRLAELRMTEQNRVQNGYERKAVLLITFCLVLIGYLLADTSFLWFKLLPMALLSFAAIKAFMILEFTEFGIQGIHPDITTKSSYFAGNKATLLEYACQEYSKRINENAKLLLQQTKYLESARPVFYWGIAIAFLVTVIEKLCT